ncbi:MAG: hypothetical protein LUO80_12905 [Methylococcaceae bacterium]|jgi:hypothetical protein|nr:hypothetical protein [Methylococcaceae bacterium]
MFKINLDEMLSHPVHTSAFIALFSLLIFLPLIRPPIVLTAVLVTGLVYLSMYFGALFARRPDA